MFFRMLKEGYPFVATLAAAFRNWLVSFLLSVVRFPVLPLR
jgi:hypothetical protein